MEIEGEPFRLIHAVQGEAKKDGDGDRSDPTRRTSWSGPLGPPEITHLLRCPLQVDLEGPGPVCPDFFRQNARDIAQNARKNAPA